MPPQIDSLDFFCADPACGKWTRISLPTGSAPPKAIRCSGCRKPLGHDYCPDCGAFHERHEDIGQSTYCHQCGGTLEHGVGAVAETTSIFAWRVYVAVGAAALFLMIFPYLPLLSHPPYLQKLAALGKAMNDQIFVASYPFAGAMGIFFAMGFLALCLANNPPWQLGLLYVLFTGRRSGAVSPRGMTINPLYAAVILTTRRRESTRNTMRLRRRALVVGRAIRARFRQRFSAAANG